MAGPFFLLGRPEGSSIHGIDPVLFPSAIALTPPPRAILHPHPPGLVLSIGFVRPALRRRLTLGLVRRVCTEFCITTHQRPTLGQTPTRSFAYRSGRVMNICIIGADGVPSAIERWRLFIFISRHVGLFDSFFFNSKRFHFHTFRRQLNEGIQSWRNLIESWVLF